MAIKIRRHLAVFGFTHWETQSEVGGGGGGGQVALPDNRRVICIRVVHLRLAPLCPCAGNTYLGTIPVHWLFSDTSRLQIPLRFVRQRDLSRMFVPWTLDNLLSSSDVQKYHKKLNPFSFFACEYRFNVFDSVLGIRCRH